MKKIPKTHNPEDVPKISTYRTSWKAKFLEAMKEKGELLGKIERLTEKNNEIFQRYLKAIDKNADLQAENERLKIDLDNEKNWCKIQTRQAIKDTAKEIYLWLKEHTFDWAGWCIVKTYFRERYGVEVE